MGQSSFVGSSGLSALFVVGSNSLLDLVKIVCTRTRFIKSHPAPISCSTVMELAHNDVLKSTDSVAKQLPEVS